MMKHILLFVFLNATFLSLLPPSLSAQNSSQRLLEEYNLNEVDSMFRVANAAFRDRALDSCIRLIFQKLNGTMLIAKGNQVIKRETSGVMRFYEQGILYRDWTTRERITSFTKKSNQLKNNTLYELASITKQFTAVSILQLIEKGKLKLNDTLRKFYPELPYSGVTIHHLLSHTSGLPEYFDLPNKYFDTSHILSNQELISILAIQQPPFIFLPGDNYKYTNTNYVLLASIVEKVGDICFEEYVKQNLFLPAGMTESCFITELLETPRGNTAAGHLSDHTEVPRHFMDGTIGDKGIYSNPEELLKWKIALFDKKIIISDKSLYKATSKQNYIHGRGKANEIYGYGFRIENNKGLGKLIFHGGLWKGFQNVMVYRQDSNTVIIFLSNLRNSAHYGKSNSLLQIMEGA
ncbi:MAG: beta-lactamase family protein [Bacteroidales bacterium]|jgi:CubicO group peptidase (beta-lactamase class C family)|nr:beta-lactamase family protein [Bacteroidales bacterium]